MKDIAKALGIFPLMFLVVDAACYAKRIFLCEVSLALSLALKT